jgi:hypothetical protein
MGWQGPLHVEGWDKALTEVSKASMTSGVLSSTSAAELLRCVTNLPVLVIAGVQDHLVPLKAAQSLTSQLPLSVSCSLAMHLCTHLFLSAQFLGLQQEVYVELDNI